jgi:hypothetical protein
LRPGHARADALLVAQVAQRHAELRDLVPELLTRHHAHDRLGLAAKQRDFAFLFGQHLSQWSAQVRLSTDITHALRAYDAEVGVHAVRSFPPDHPTFYEARRVICEV